MAEQQDKSPDTAAPTSSEDEFREEIKKYGVAYAVMGGAFKSKGLTIAARVVSWGIVAAAAAVIVLAILSKF